MSPQGFLPKPSFLWLGMAVRQRRFKIIVFLHLWGSKHTFSLKWLRSKENMLKIRCGFLYSFPMLCGILQLNLLQDRKILFWSSLDKLLLEVMFFCFLLTAITFTYNYILTHMFIYLSHFVTIFKHYYNSNIITFSSCMTSNKDIYKCLRKNTLYTYLNNMNETRVCSDSEIYPHQSHNGVLS